MDSSKTQRAVAAHCQDLNVLIARFRTYIKEDSVNKINQRFKEMINRTLNSVSVF